MRAPPCSVWKLLAQGAVLAGCVLVCAAPASAAQGAGPTIDGTTVTNITEHGASIEAHINPRGRETLYEIRLVWQAYDPPLQGELVTGGVQSQAGRIAAASEEATVSLALTDLQCCNTYWYEVRAGSRGGETNGKSPYWFDFHNSRVYPEGWAPYMPYESLVPFWSIFLSEEESAQTVREYEEKQRAAAITREEQQAREAARIATEAAQLKRISEQEATARAVARPACSVPSLHGQTLSTARRALARAHCRLGRVGTPRHHRGVLIITRQTPRAGKKLADAAAIAVTLGPRPHEHRSST
jgi:hypothetical protein